MFPFDPSLSTAEVMWQRINWCTVELPGIRRALDDSTAKIRRLLSDIKQKEGETLMKWRTRNPSTVLAIRFWSQVQELGEDLINREEYLGDVVTEGAPLLRAMTASIPTHNIQRPCEFTLPSEDPSAHPSADLAGTSTSTSTGTGTGTGTGSNHNHGSNLSYSSTAASVTESECETVFDSNLSRSPSRSRELLTPASEVAEPGHEEAHDIPKTPTTLHNFPMLPAELRLVIWESLVAPPRCHRYYGTINSLYELPTRPYIKTQDDHGLWSACPESRALMFRIYGKEKKYTQNNPPNNTVLCYDGCLCYGLYFESCVRRFAFEMGKFIFKFHFYYQLVKRLEAMLDVEQRDPTMKRPHLWAIRADDLPKAKVDMMYELLQGTYFYSWLRLLPGGYPGIGMSWPNLSGSIVLQYGSAF